MVNEGCGDGINPFGRRRRSQSIVRIWNPLFVTLLMLHSCSKHEMTSTKSLLFIHVPGPILVQFQLQWLSQAQLVQAFASSSQHPLTLVTRKRKFIKGIHDLKMNSQQDGSKHIQSKDQHVYQPKHKQQSAPCHERQRHKSFLPTSRFLQVKQLFRDASSNQEIQEWLVAQNSPTCDCTNHTKSCNNPLHFRPSEQTQLIKELTRRSAFDQVIYFMTYFSNHSVQVYTLAIASLSQSKQLHHSQKATRLLQQMEQYKTPPNRYTFAALFYNMHGPLEARQYLQYLQQRYCHKCSSELYTLQVYNAAIHACSRKRRHWTTQASETSSSTVGNKFIEENINESWQTALQLYRTMQTSHSIVPDLSTYSSLLLTLAPAGQVKIAMSLLEEMPIPPNEVVWGAALTVCSKAGDYQQAALLLREMSQHSSVAMTTRHISAYLGALAKAGHDRSCLIILKALKKNQPFPLVDPTAPTNTEDNNPAGKSLGLWLQPVPIDLVLVNTVIHACAQAHNYNDARRLLLELKNGEYVTTATPTMGNATTRKTMNNSATFQRNKDVKRDGLSAAVIQPDEITYNSVISACTDATQVKALVKEMRQSRRHRAGQVPPSTKTYTLAIAACKLDWESALFLMQDCQHDGIKPNVFMYSAAIWIAEKCGKAEEALKLLQDMKDVGCEPNNVSYGGVIAALAVHGRAHEATQLFAEMKAKGLSTNGKIFGRMAQAIDRASLFDKSTDVLALLESVVDLMNDNDFYVKIAGPILEPIILQYGMSDRFHDALLIFDRIRGPTNGPCLRAILSACALAPDQWEVALDLLHTSDIVEGVRGPARIDMRAIGFAMLACSKSGQWEEAMNLLDLYGRRDLLEDGDVTGHVPRSAINSLITACGRGGRPDMALKLLNEMKSKYGVEPNEISYRSAAIACNQAQHESRRRQERGLAPRSASTALQWWECSLSLLRRMKEEGLNPDAQTYSSVISACEAAGQWQRALGVLRDGPEEMNLYCYNAAISACEKGGAWVEALELYYQMLEKGGVVNPNFVTLSSLLIALDAAGQKELAQDLYEQGLASKVVRRPWTRTRAAISGDLIRALDFHNYSSAMARTALRSVMESLINNGKPEHDVTKDLIVVVGKGKGSKFDPVLGQTVEELLEKNYGIRCVVDSENAGRLVVKASDLESFTKANSAWR